MAWTYLTVAGLFEIGWAIGLKYTDGFTRLLPSLWTIASMILSIVLLGWRSRRSRSGPLTRCGPESAQSGPPRSASTYLQSRQLRCG
jgi:hypothetical protein